MTDHSKIRFRPVLPCGVVCQIVAQGLQGGLVLVSCQEFVAIVTREHEQHETEEDKTRN